MAPRTLLFVAVTCLLVAAEGFHMSRFQSITKLKISFPSSSLFRDKHVLSAALQYEGSNNLKLSMRRRGFDMIHTVSSIVKAALPIVAAVILLTAFGPSVAFAAKIKAKEVAREEMPSLLRKLLDGANVKGKFKTWKAGDTRAEFAAIVNFVSSAFIFGALGFVAFLRHKQREMYQSSALKKELVKVREYKENMYFEAVQEILNKMNDSKTKGSTKANLQKQLKDLDPEGVIQEFLKGNGKRPDISNLINRKPVKRGKPSGDSKLRGKPSDDTKGSSTKKPPTTSKPPPTTSSRTSRINRDDNDDSEDEEEPVNKGGRKGPRGSASEDADDDGRTIQQVLDTLSESLAGQLSDAQRKKLVANLKARLEAIADSQKRMSAATKIADRLGDTEYWEAYVSRL